MCIHTYTHEESVCGRLKAFVLCTIGNQRTPQAPNISITPTSGSTLRKTNMEPEKGSLIDYCSLSRPAFQCSF